MESIKQRIAAFGFAPNPLLSWKIEFLDLEKDFCPPWSHVTSKDSTSRKAALAALAEMKNRVDDWIEIARLRMAGGIASATELDPGELRDALQRAGRMLRLIAFTIADLEGGHLKTPVFDRLSSALLALCSTELYLAEQVEIVDGGKTSTYRAVTLGKLVRLVIILLVGWVILLFVSRRVKSLVARLISDSANHRGSCRQGHHHQLPLRIGDYFEVHGVAGTIRANGMRASVIQHDNGIDKVTPNSNLPENKVTNWTLSDSLLRHSVKLGVEYGSPPRQVAKTLLAVASEHGLVLDYPTPKVRFENFGEKQLDFPLLFWFDNRKTSRDALASDLRFMIEKKLCASRHPHRKPAERRPFRSRNAPSYRTFPRYKTRTLKYDFNHNQNHEIPHPAATLNDPESLETPS